MILRQLCSWIDKAIFCAGLLLGIQVPGFISHYIQRLGGHLDEARAHLEQYQIIANQWTDGDLKVLLQKYYESNEPIFRETGAVLDRLIQRVDSLAAQLQSLNEATVLKQIEMMALQADQELLEATWRAFTFNAPLTPDTLAIGVITGVLLSLVWMGSCASCRYGVNALIRPKPRRSSWMTPPRKKIR